MKPKLIALDLDGTTLNGQSEFNPITIQTLHRLTELGHKVAIVTGRPYRSSKHLYEELGLGGPIVNFNGALCHIPTDENWQGEFHVTLDEEIVFDMLEFHKELECDYFMVEGKHHLYATIENIPDSPYYPKDQQPILLQKDTKLVEKPTAITVFSSIEKQPFIKEKIKQRYGHTIDVRTWGGDMPCLEIVTYGIDKSTGIQHLSRYYGIPTEDVLAFGDEDNDLEMIEFAGHGVAMNNAIDSLKAIADDITPLPHDQDGLAHYLINYFKLEA
ncbi:Cof-type HAD-IIB family hydrolase [uncultured Granulicatella sp.]|uniref:Cof-type HAD-IIB family hydrolase n=1 Tax=uncultured Granulicatella sp. TaxID=316089 RepID=UPI0028D9073F|nr:Cof-type HAD-IIB family hydrolase [uncultured Granulicatella sp.]